MKFLITCLLVFGFVSPHRIQAQNIVWDPENSTYDGKSFVQLQPGIGATSPGFPSASNPVGAGIAVSGVYAFGFATAIPGATGPTMSQTELNASALKAGTNLVLRFTKAETEQVSFIAMVADASDPGNIGFKQLSPTQIEIRARIVNPIVSENNNPDTVEAVFGFIVQTTALPNSAFNFRGTLFVTDMHWIDLDPPGIADLPQAQSADDVATIRWWIVARHGRRDRCQWHFRKYRQFQRLYARKVFCFCPGQWCRCQWCKLLRISHLRRIDRKR
ncbi:MAG: hypothetical protein O3B73_01790 [bacterium]|nr:hypothetical protein [bacterium]